MRASERNPVTQVGVLGLPLFIVPGALTHTIQFNPDTNTDAINNKSTKQEDIILSRVGWKSLICKAAHGENGVK